ncbi:MAG TPA: hypothetical protein VGE76_18080, partial [Opitutaceae bacterium]
LYCAAAILLAVKILNAAPASVGGMLYEEYFHPALSPNQVVLYHLKTDGTYVLLTNDIRSREQTTPLPAKGSQLPTSGAVETGTWDYTLAADGRTAAFRLGGTRKNLVFSGDSDGGGLFAATDFRFYRPTTGDAQRNFSNRVYVTPERPAISGFVMERPRWALIRVVGPGLAQFGVSSPLAAPVMQLYQSGLIYNGGRVFEMRAWLSTPNPGQSQLEEVAALVGAFPLAKGSADCAVLRLLEPGNYTAHGAADAGGPSGEALIEVFYLPFEFKER